MSAAVERFDVLVAGGGPAGLAAAIAARLEGLSVAVVERARPPIDKACGEGLMPDGLARLASFGVRPRRRHVFQGIRYLDGEVVAEGRFRGTGGAGVRRTDLHAALVSRTEELGAACRWGTRLTGLEGKTLLTTSGPMEGRYLVAADGLRSKLRRWAGLEGRPARHRRFGVRRHFALPPWSDCVEVYWGDGLEAYVTPVAPREVGVAILWSGRKASFDALLAAFPSLRERLAGAEPISRPRGIGPLQQRVRGVVRGSLALVGDASGYLDAITGEGLSLAFHQAAALAGAMAAGDLSAYARAHRRLARFPFAFTHALLAIERRPGLRRRLIRALARDPRLFSHLLEIHAGRRSVRDVVAAPRLLLRLLAPA